MDYVFNDNKEKIDAIEYIQDHSSGGNIDFDDVYPDGSIYISTNVDWYYGDGEPEYPGIHFGGDWVLLYTRYIQADSASPPYKYAVWQKFNQAYAYYSIPGKHFVLFRDIAGKYENGQHIFGSDIPSYRQYTSVPQYQDHGVVFTDFENLGPTEEPPWQSYYIGNDKLTDNIFSDEGWDGVEVWAPIHPTSTYRWFKDMEYCDSMNLYAVTYDGNVLPGLDTTNTLYMDDMFQNCFELGSLDLWQFDTRNVQSANNMFASYDSENPMTISEIAIGDSWDMSQLDDTTGSNMFLNCTSLPGYTSSDVSYRKAVPESQGGYLYKDDISE